MAKVTLCFLYFCKLRIYLMLEEYLTKIKLSHDYKPFQLGANITIHQTEMPNLEGKKIAFLGVAAKSDKNPACDIIRHELYQLIAQNTIQQDLVDLGNVIEGETPADTYIALKEIAKELKKQGLVTILLGSKIDQGEALYHSYIDPTEPIELSLISAQLPMLEYELLHRICAHQPNLLLTIHALAFQAHYIPPKAIDTLENLNFGHYRLGAIKSNIEDAELHLRNSAITLFDLNAIKHTEAPGKQYAQPNGLTSEEACQLARYAGLSDVSEFFGLFEFIPENDTQNLTAKLAAQIIWYYLDGFAHRKQDTPSLHDEFVKYRCDLKDNQPATLFLKSKRTNRWWMQVDHHFIPCSYSDYQQAAAGELSERYLNALKKLH
jgi:formiminoglutamase